MKVDSALGIAKAGMDRAHQGMREEANNIARATGPADTPDVTKAFVNLMKHHQQFTAAAKVVETVDQALRSLFPEKQA